MTSTETLTPAQREHQAAQSRLADYMEWRENVIFMSTSEMRVRLNKKEDQLVVPPDMIFVCVLSRPEDLLQIANRMQDPTPLVNAKLLKQVWVKEDIGEEEMAYLEKEGLIDSDAELYVSAQEFGYQEHSKFAITDVNEYYQYHQRVHVEPLTEDRGDYTKIPDALTSTALALQYPRMLLVSDHSTFDRAGDMDIRHTMTFDMPANVAVSSAEFLEISPQ